jgi:hypothetical protein
MLLLGSKLKEKFVFSVTDLYVCTRTALLNQIFDSAFYETYTPTIFVDFKSKMINRPDRPGVITMNCFEVA